jgi:hypothetical protein
MKILVERKRDDIPLSLKHGAEGGEEFQIASHFMSAIRIGNVRVFA